jgi:hypothetical protein
LSQIVATFFAQLLDTTAFLGNDTEYYKQYTSRIVSLYINSTFTVLQPPK